MKMAFYCVTEGRNAGKKQSFLARIFSAPLMAATLFQFVVDTVLCVTVSGRRFLYSCLPFSNLKYLYRLYPQFTRKTVRRHKICVLLRCFDSMYARYMSFLRALPGTNFMPSDSGELKRREFLHFRFICSLTAPARGPAPSGCR